MWNGSGSQLQTKSKEGFEGYLDKCVAIAERAGKELIANETVWGARDDATHVEVMRYTLAQLTQRGIGFTHCTTAWSPTCTATSGARSVGRSGCTSSRPMAPCAQATRRSTSSAPSRRRDR